MDLVAVCLPSRGRVGQMVAGVEKLLAATLPRGVDVVVVLAVCEDDGDSVVAALELARDSRVCVTVRPVGSTAAEGWNQAAALVPSADWFVLGADDVTWDERWLVEAVRAADGTGARVVGLNDGHTDLHEYGPHYMAHRNFVRDVLGGCLVPPGYKAWWFDREVCERARGLGVYAAAWDSMVIHNHPDWGTAVMDETYERAWPEHDRDRLVYLERMGKL